MRVLLLSLLSILPLCLFGQETKDGFIIINNGQFKYGNIQISNSESRYTECLFKESSKSEFKKYTSDDIEGYGIIDGSKFIAREIKINSQLKKMFLKSEFEGFVKLFSYLNRIFIEDDTLIELIEPQGEYKNVLSNVLSSCKNIDPVVKRTSFDVKSITSLFEQYGVCLKSDFVLPKKVTTYIEVVGGVELNSTRLTSNIPSFYFANVETLKDKTLLSTGLRVQISLARIKSLSFCTGLYFYQQQFYLLSTSGTNPTNTDKLNLDFNEFVLPLNVQYSPNNKKKIVYPYVRAGISIPFVTSPSLTLEHYEESYNVVYIDHYDAMKSFKQSVQLDVAGGINFTLSKKIKSFVEFHYNTVNGEITTNLSDTEIISSKSKRINIVVGLRF